ncbi:MAG: hypothetical protein ACRC6I_16625, partial [Paracoccaceae bacterium]
MDDATIGQMLGQQEVPDGQPATAQPAPIMMDQQTFSQILQAMVQAQMQQMQAPPAGPPPGAPQGGPPMPPPGGQPVDPRIAQALMVQ